MMGMKRSAGGVLLLVVWLTFTLYVIYANDEGDALSAFKNRFEGGDPDGALLSWDSSLPDPCTWFHISCNKDNSVTRVDLGNAKLSGQLVPELGKLKNLQFLELYQNKISGSIPNELGNLNSLVGLDLYNNDLTGHIPETLGKLSKLKNLRLNNNGLTGSIPTTLTTITSLQLLDLSNNHLSGVVPINGSFASFTPKSFANNPDLCYPGVGPGSC